jgi:hypothetical protein
MQKKLLKMKQGYDKKKAEQLNLQEESADKNKKK